MATGCATLRKLWNNALECQVENPGITGTPNRVSSFVQCRNIRDAMAIASLKCWEERTGASYPPMVIVDDIIKRSVNTKNNAVIKQETTVTPK